MRKISKDCKGQSMKKIIVFTLAFMLASCSGGTTKAPRDLNDACSIKHQRKSWYKELKRSERKWGIPVSVMMATIYQESKFDGKAKTPQKYAMRIIPLGRQSTAYGFSQAIDGTWEWYKKDQKHPRAKRDRFSDAVDFMGWYMNESNRRNGISKRDAYRQYLAYHDGHSGYAKGSYRKKSWLRPVARRVSERAIMYQLQLSQCR